MPDWNEWVRGRLEQYELAANGEEVVAELAAHLRLPAAVTKVLLSDLVDCGALTTKSPAHHHNPTDRSLLEAVLDGLRRQL